MDIAVLTAFSLVIIPRLREQSPQPEAPQAALVADFEPPELEVTEGKLENSRFSS